MSDGKKVEEKNVTVDVDPVTRDVIQIRMSEEQVLAILLERKQLREQVTALQERGTKLLDMYRSRVGVRMNVKVKLVKPENSVIKLPEYKTEEAAGLDLQTAEDFVLEPGERRRVSTGIAMEIPSGFVGKVFPRSGITFDHGVAAWDGTIDSDYRGEIKVLMFNLSHTTFTAKAGERIAQLVLLPHLRASLSEVPELSPTVRGERGFGSTGR